jgi:hypothetical protein
MADTAQVVINLATGLEDAERVTVAFLVGAAVERRKQVAISLTKEAVRLPCRATPRRSHVTAARRSPGTSSCSRRRRKPARLSHLLQRPQAGPG